MVVIYYTLSITFTNKSLFPPRDPTTYHKQPHFCWLTQDTNLLIRNHNHVSSYRIQKSKGKWTVLEHKFDIHPVEMATINLKTSDNLNNPSEPPKSNQRIPDPALPFYRQHPKSSFYLNLLKAPSHMTASLKPTNKRTTSKNTTCTTCRNMLSKIKMMHTKWIYPLATRPPEM